MTAVGALLVAATVAASCSQGSAPAGSGTATVTGSPPDPFGTITIAPGQPIELGTFLTMTGDNAEPGLDSLRGVELAVDYLDGKLDGKPGQLLGHAIKLLSQDDHCGPTGQTGAQKLADDPQIVAVIGPSCSGAALGVADKIMSAKGMLLISPSATDPYLTQPGTHQPFFLRTAYNDLIQGSVLADFAYKQLSLKTAATVHDDSPFGSALVTAFRGPYVQLGGSVTAAAAVSSAGSAVSAAQATNTLGGSNPAFLLSAAIDPACLAIAKAAKNAPGLGGVAFTAGEGCMSSSYLAAGGAAVNGTYLAGPDLWAFQTQEFYANEFLTAYKTQFGTAPTGGFHAEAYDAASILFDALSKTAKKAPDGTLTIPRTALEEAMYATKDYQGLSGTLTCSALGDCAPSATIAVYQLPNVPLEGGNPLAQPVYAETKSLADVLPSPGG
jgi:branched-chain amino acid transport system substrate-binding protein